MGIWSVNREEDDGGKVEKESLESKALWVAGLGESLD